MMAPSTDPNVAGGLGWPWPVALIAMLALASLFGFINGFCVVKFRMNALMVTIGSMLGLLGGALVLGRTYRIYDIPSGFKFIGAAQMGDISVAVIFVGALLIAAAVWMKKSVFGAHLYAIGGNRLAARAAGVNDGRVIITAFTVCGFLAGLSAFILMGRLGTASAGMSNGAIFLVVAAAIVGGVSLFGGRGGVGGMVGGLLLIGMITNVLSLARISSLYVNVVTGAIILIALGIDAFKNRGTQKE